MNSDSADRAVTRKEFKSLKRSGYRDGKLFQSTVIRGFVPERSKKAKHKRYGTRSAEPLISSNNCPSSSDSEEDSEDYDNDEEEEYDYISLFQVWMNFLFPRAFRVQPVHRWIKSAQSVSDLRERRTGKILSPVGRCSLFPQGVFVQSTTEKDVTKICFPRAQETFKAPSRPSRNHKQTL